MAAAGSTLPVVHDDPEKRPPRQTQEISAKAPAQSKPISKPGRKYWKAV
jgi:hypothetical protein